MLLVCLPQKPPPHPPRHSTPNSRPFNRLRPLCSLLPAPVLCFQSFAASFPKTPGVGVLSIRRRRQILERPSGIEGSQPPSSFVSYHILVNPVLSCNYAPFCAMASQQVQHSQLLTHSFYHHGGGTPLLRICSPPVSVRSAGLEPVGAAMRQTFPS